MTPEPLDEDEIAGEVNGAMSELINTAIKDLIVPAIEKLEVDYNALVEKMVVEYNPFGIKVSSRIIHWEEDTTRTE